jgi:tetratricopeptide (TPR) repeat protein
MAVFHRVGIALIAVMAAAVPGAAQSPSEQLMLDWLALVRSHEPGTMDAASTSASEWSPDQVEIFLPQALAAIDAPTLIRALSMHTDIALAQQATMARPVVGSRTAVVLLDGRPLDQISRSQQWRLCWRLAAGLARRDRGPAVASWFRATGAVLQQLADCDLLRHHLDVALALFPQDAVIALYAGTLHQTFADPRVQQYMARRRVSPVPAHVRMIGEGPGFFGSPSLRQAQDGRLRVGGEGSAPALPEATDVELARARDLFRRPLQLDPSLHEARIRLAHVLGDLGEHAQAVATARPALATTLVPFFEFYAAVILGRSEEHLGHYAAAGDAYARAAARFPGSESAELGRSRIALAQGRAGDAVAIAIGVVGPESDEHADPWASYFRVHDPDAGALLAAWRAGLP